MPSSRASRLTPLAFGAISAQPVLQNKVPIPNVERHWKGLVPPVKSTLQIGGQSRLVHDSPRVAFWAGGSRACFRWIADRISAASRDDRSRQHESLATDVGLSGMHAHRSAIRDRCLTKAKRRTQ